MTRTSPEFLCEDNGVWFTKEKLFKSLQIAEREKDTKISDRTVYHKKIHGRLFVWAGTPKKRQIKKGIVSLRKMGFHYVRLINGDFFVSTKNEK
jgi:fido (protein-threonine AMPylation protein)